MDYIKKIGIELEGLWSYAPIDAYEDSSVEFNIDDDDDSNYFIGECSFMSDDLIELKNMIKDRYPEDVNSSCGMHCHLSFQNDIYYTLFTRKRFYDYFLSKMHSFGVRNKINEKSAFWRRLNGQNNFCYRSFIPSEQLKTDCNNRYTQLNFCYEEHRTIEVRLLPMFKKIQLAFLAVDELVNIFESWIDIHYDQIEQLRKPIKRRVLM